MSALAKYEPTAGPELSDRLDFIVWSKASDPHAQGRIFVRCTPDGMQIRWDGDKDWQSISWHEIVEIALADAGHIISENVKFAVDKAYNEGILHAQADFDANLETKRREMKSSMYVVGKPAPSQPTGEPVTAPPRRPSSSAQS